MKGSSIKVMHTDEICRYEEMRVRVPLEELLTISHKLEDLPSLVTADTAVDEK